MQRPYDNTLVQVFCTIYKLRVILRFEIYLENSAATLISFVALGGHSNVRALIDNCSYPSYGDHSSSMIIN